MTLVLEIGWNEAATTAAIVDTAAHSRVGEGKAVHPVATGGLAEPADWWDATVQAVRLAVDGLSALGLPADDLHTMVIGAGDPAGGLVALGADSVPVHPAVVGSHLASEADAGWLIGHVDGGSDAWLAATDVLPTAGSTAALLSWLHRSDPDAWTAATRFTLPSGWLLERLGGDSALGIHDAVGTALVDHHSGSRWRLELLGVVDGDRDWSAALPTIVTEAHPVGLLSAAAAAELGVPAELPLHVGGAAPTATPG